MHAHIAQRHEALSALCRKYGVARLEVFGSAARAVDFDAAASDIDFLVEFKEEERDLSALGQFFGLSHELEHLLKRKVDLIEAGAVKNPFLLQGINSSRELVYAA